MHFIVQMHTIFNGVGFLFWRKKLMLYVYGLKIFRLCWPQFLFRRLQANTADFVFVCTVYYILKNTEILLMFPV